MIKLVISKSSALTPLEKSHSNKGILPFAHAMNIGVSSVLYPAIEIKIINLKNRVLLFFFMLSIETPWLNNHSNMIKFSVLQAIEINVPVIGYIFGKSKE